MLLIAVSVIDVLDRRRPDRVNDADVRNRRIPLGDADPRAMDWENVRVNHGSRHGMGQRLYVPSGRLETQVVFLFGRRQLCS
jgi:hypothetical protein